MKNKYFLFLVPFLALTSCSLFNKPEEKKEESSTLSDEDKAYPGKSNLRYNEYLDNSEINESKFYFNKNHNLNMPDPFVIKEGDTYYVYGTTDRLGSNGVDCYSTQDFNTYTLHRDIYPMGQSWVKSGIFAVEVYKFANTYFMYYSANDVDGKRALNVATSSSPTGPFTDYVGLDSHGNNVDYKTNKWLEDSTIYSPLDQTLLVDDDGKIFLYYSVYHSGYEQYIVGMEMSDPVTYDMSTRKVLVRPGKDSPELPDNDITLKYDWEIMRSFWVAEGPCVIKSPINHKYYLTYTVNAYNEKAYTVCYAVSDSPLGDYHKPFVADRNWSNLFFGYAGLSTKTNDVYKQWAGFHAGTGHHSIFKAGNDYMIVYHGWKNRGNPDNFDGRDTFIDRVYFDKEGNPYTVGPTYSPQPLPKGISGYENVALKSKIETENVDNDKALIDNYIVEHYQLKGEEEKEATLKKGKSYIKFTFDKEYSLGGLLIYNSAFFNNITSGIEFINFKNGNAIFDAVFSEEFINNESEFVFPSSSFAFEFPDDIKASEMVICVNTNEPVRLNEIYVMGK